MKAYQAKVGENYFLDVGGWLPPNTPARFVEFSSDGAAVFVVTNVNGEIEEIAIDKNEAIQEMTLRNNP